MHNLKTELANTVTADIIRFIAEDFGESIEEAMKRFYESEVFGKLHDFETGLYRESSGYVYDLYKTEHEYGRLVQLKE
jgi:hypothetical protein